MNKFDSDGGEDVLVKRSVINRYSTAYYPTFENDGTHTYILAYDPAAKIDNSVIGVGELIRDEEKGLMLKIVNVKNLIEVLKNGEKMVIQRPEQIEILKDMICDYNRGKSEDYDAINMIIIDQGGGGNEVAQFLMNEWIGKDKKNHIGLIDLEDDYMKMREDDYPQNCQKLRLFNFKRNKTQGYERTQRAINEGLVIFPSSINARGEIEFETQDAQGNPVIKFEKPSLREIDALVQIDLCKEELVGMCKQKKPNGTIVFDISPEAKQRNMHDDHADIIMMMCDRLMELRAEETLAMERPNEDFSKVFTNAKPKDNKKKNPFTSGNNPFSQGRGYNPFR